MVGNCVVNLVTFMCFLLVHFLEALDDFEMHCFLGHHFYTIQGGP